jgi:serine/threonine protein kinase
MSEGLRIGRSDDPDHYEFGQQVASGGEATLHLGSVRGPGGRIPVAIKIPLPDYGSYLDRLYGRWSEQVELLRSVRHPGIVTVRETFIGMPPHGPSEQLPGRQLYLIMDWVDGVPLDEWLLDHPETNHLRRVRSLSQIADVLDRVHTLRFEDAEAIVHRDVKPNNIIMGDNGPVLVDWGLVRGLVPDATLVPGEGGPGFMAPEVLHEGRFSPASDRFSFGCVVYFALTGQYPPADQDPQAFRAGLMAVPGLADQPATVEHILKMFDPNPAARPLSCREWLAGITRSTVIPVSGSIPPPAPPKPPVRRPWERILGAVAALAVIAIFVAVIARGGDTPAGGTGPPSTSTSSTSSTATSSTTSTTTTTTTTRPPPTVSPRVTPDLPTTAEEAGRVFGVPDSVAHYGKVDCCGWTTSLSVPLKLYPGLCVDFDLNADPTRVLTGETYWVEVNSQMHRALMKGEGTIMGGATIFWSTCNHIA